MDRRFFELHDKNEREPARWYLKGPVGPDGSEVDPRLFTEGHRLDMKGPFRIPLRRPGKERDFTLADFEMPVLLASFADALEKIAPEDIQRFPATVDGSRRRYEVINVLSTVDCLDEELSDVAYWTEAGGLPQMVGKYLTVANIRVDPSRIGPQQIFRLRGWESVLIVTEAVRRVLKTATGAVFEPV